MLDYSIFIDYGFVLSGLYIGAHGLYTSEVIHLQRKFGQWKEDNGTMEPSNLEFYEYVEALKITGDPYVPAGQVSSLDLINYGHLSLGTHRAKFWGA